MPKYQYQISCSKRVTLIKCINCCEPQRYYNSKIYKKTRKHLEKRSTGIVLASGKVCVSTGIEARLSWYNIINIIIIIIIIITIIIIIIIIIIITTIIIISIITIFIIIKQLRVWGKQVRNLCNW